MKLHKAQERFKETMLDQPVAVESPADDLLNLFNEGDIPLSERLKVYRNNIIGGMTDNVKTAFPILNILVGEAFLELLIRSYILENPPEKGCLNTYGEGLPEFIEKFEAAKAMPYLSDVARLEVAQNNAYYAKNDTPLSAQDLAKIPTDKLEEITLKPRQSAQLVKSRFPLLKIKAFCEKTTDSNDEKLNIDQGGVSLLVFRPSLEIKILEIGDNEHLFLKSLKDEQTLGTAVETTMGQDPNFDIQNILQKHVTLETFAKLDTN